MNQKIKYFLIKVKTWKIESISKVYRACRLNSKNQPRIKEN